ncbi:hypothetical protein QBC41DRAFT_395628 [Cercophora samala]|uniref:Uncharacterized protein n=1 Tax=Cercophora samala TaxID=330535 RepID=A0AA40DDX7_9PEZI|nr:hypothetical protein QBC41DRAFT_395628 [Cercophora samala]
MCRAMNLLSEYKGIRNTFRILPHERRKEGWRIASETRAALMACVAYLTRLEEVEKYSERWKELRLATIGLQDYVWSVEWEINHRRVQADKQNTIERVIEELLEEGWVVRDEEGGKGKGKGRGRGKGKRLERLERVSEGEVSKGEVSYGEVSQGEVSEGEVSHGEVSHGEVSHGEVSRGEVSEGEVRQGEGSQGKVSQGKVSQGEGSQGERSLEEAESASRESGSSLEFRCVG